MSTVQFNLLPDIKVEYLKSQRLRRTILASCIAVAGVLTGIFILLFLTVNVVQKKQINDAGKAVTNYSNQLKGKDNLESILTVRNQLTSLVTLHQNKHIASRIFTYLPQVTPTNVSIGSVNLSFADNTMTIDGTADSQKTVNIFIDTLKFTTYTVGSDTTQKNAFTKVILANFSVNPGNTGYTINASFDPVLFQNQVDSQSHAIVPALHVPSTTTTRSVVDDPSNVLFNGQLNTKKK